MSPSKILRLAFAGTPDFALPCLEAITQSRHALVQIFTQPDRPAGRGRRLKPSPVAQWAQTHYFSVLKPENNQQLQLDLEKESKLDLLIVVAYGMLLHEPILNFPRLGCWNVHASLLPRWRGAAPIARAVLSGDQRTGISIMKMDAGLDTGPVVCQQAQIIQPGATTDRLTRDLANLGAQILPDVLDALADTGLTPMPQDSHHTCYAAKLQKQESWIDWTLPATELCRRIWAYNPRPGARTRFKDQDLLLWAAAEISVNQGIITPSEAGRVMSVSDSGIDVATGRGMVRLLEVQPAGGRRMSAAQFARGRTMLNARLFSGAPP